MNNNQNNDVCSKSVGYVDDKRCELHCQGKTHPESPLRTLTIRSKILTIPDLIKIEGREASEKELQLVHNKDLIKRVKHLCRKIVSGEKEFAPDVKLNQNSYLSARVAAGCVLSAVDSVMKGEVKRVFCNIRPPGHHASSEESSGFCVFNNVAVGVRYLQSKYHVNKVAIIDWDVHHGNGTEDIFSKDSNVLYLSLHQSPFYPGTGYESDIKNNTYNYPLPSKYSSKSYREKFVDSLKCLDEFKPEIIFISCGFDAHIDDPLGNMNLSDDDYAYLTKLINDISNKYCDGRIISVLEGGYDVDAISRSALLHVKQLQSF